MMTKEEFQYNLDLHNATCEITRGGIIGKIRLWVDAPDGYQWKANKSTVLVTVYFKEEEIEGYYAWLVRYMNEGIETWKV